MRLRWQLLPAMLLAAGFGRAEEGIRVIELPCATLRLASRSGDLVGIQWKHPELEVIQEPRLGENFRLLLPEVGFEAAYFNSREQDVSRIEPTADGVVCHYDRIWNSRETLPIKVRYSIRAAGDQLHFAIEIENPTDRKLAEVYYAILAARGNSQIPCQYM